MIQKLRQSITPHGNEPQLDQWHQLLIVLSFSAAQYEWKILPRLVTQVEGSSEG
jgi:hypothetical protein